MKICLQRARIGMKLVSCLVRPFRYRGREDGNGGRIGSRGLDRGVGEVR